MKTKENIKYEGWKLSVDDNSIEVSKDGEHRIYNLNDIQDTLHEDEYVILKKDDGGFYQVKFGENNFLVIDEFDEYDEFVDSIANYVFNE